MAGFNKVRLMVDDIGENTVVEIWSGGKLLVRHLLDAASLDAHIHLLAKCRTRMRDAIPDERDPGSRFETLIHPKWFIPPPEDDPPEGRVMLVRHPGLGWLAFVFPHTEAAKIAEWLTKSPETNA